MEKWIKSKLYGMWIMAVLFFAVLSLTAMIMGLAVEATAQLMLIPWEADGMQDDASVERAANPEKTTAAYHGMGRQEQDSVIIRRESAQAGSLRMMFAGDTMMTGNVARMMDLHGVEYPLSEIGGLLQEADLLVMNLETAVGESGILMDKPFAFQTLPQNMEMLLPYRDNLVLTLANNHGMDAPLAETMRHLDEMGFHYVGIGKNERDAYAPFVREINGVSVAVFGASQVIPTIQWRAGENSPGMAAAYSCEPLLTYIKEWVDRVDYVVAYIHWGQELADHPTRNQRRLEKALKEAGVHLIIGSHPHVWQGLEWTDGKQMTAHSLGNFVFTTSHTPLANETGILEVLVDRNTIQHVQIHPALIRMGKVVPRELSEARGFYGRLNRLGESTRITENGSVLRIRED